MRRSPPSPLQPAITQPCPAGQALKLSFRQDNPAGTAYAIVRHAYAPGRGFPAHTHQFAEVFWIEEGHGTHRINGAERPLGPGDAVFIRPEDSHATCAGPDGLTLVNVSFPLVLAADLPRRHREHWPWRDGAEPLQIRLNTRARERLRAWALDLSSRVERALDLECFLLDLTRMVRAAGDGDPADGLPDWLREACAVFADPRHLPGGTAKLAHLAGRGRAHISRLVKSHQGRTTTELVNDLRLAWAATALRLDDAPIATVAKRCGLANLGHFYELFRERYGQTPRAWRLEARSSLPGLGDGMGSDVPSLDERRGFLP